jgi:tetratricopeptide (TPR) repeat protein
MALKTIKLNNLALRAVFIVFALLALWATYFAFKWSFGNALAGQVDLLSKSPTVNPADVKEIAQLSAEMSPNDPNTHYALAVLNEKSFLPEDLPKALAGYEKAVSVSPHDFRLWLSLGKARERSGDAAGAEKAFQKALELAPNYSEPRWILGNYFLRNGKTDEAFAEIRKAVETNPDYANPAVVTAWQIFAGDTTQIAQKIGDSVPIKASLAPFLVKQKRFDDAFTFWNSIPENEKITEYKKNGEDLITAFLESKNYRHALVIQNQISPPEADKFSIGSIFNGSFEKNVPTANQNVFDWKIGEGAGLDPSQKQSGERSLIVIFNSTTGQETRTVQQTVAVESGKSYKFETFYRADLKAISTVTWEIADAADSKVLATGEAVQNSADWRALTVDFTTPATTQAVIIRLAKVPCKQGICPISGKVWFDSLSLK